MRSDQYLAEFLGTLLLMMSILASGGNAFVVGIALTIGLFFTSRTSGGHLNPAVSLAMYMKGTLTGANAGAYIVSQALGAVTALYVFKMFA